MSYSITVQGEDTIIRVHGRGSFTIPFTDTYTAEGGATVERDLSASAVYFEVKEVGLRKLTQTDPDNVNGRLIQMTRAEVEMLTDERAHFAVIDETDSTLPDVLWEGYIKQTGYEGSPS